MPYINKDERTQYVATLEVLIGELKRVPEEERDGHINFCVTWLLKRLYYPPKYKRFNAAIGVLECIKAEFYRRVVAPYEDQKIVDVGDV